MKMNIDKKATIVDVRTPEEFAQQHFPGAINIPLSDVPQRINELKQLPKPIVAYCKSGARSGMAVTILQQNGIKKTINAGGLDDMFNLKIN
jgi:phage shock protein E